MSKPLNQLDLNLLLILQMLIQERSVTKVAKRLSVTPSSVSKSLSKLRNWFNDPLFIKTPKELQPTTFVLSLKSELSEWSQITAKLSGQRMEDNSGCIKFSLSMESPLYFLAATKLPDLIVKEYPNSKTQITHWDYDSIDSIINGDVDLGFCGRETNLSSPESPHLLPYYVDHEVLFEDKPVVFIHKQHPALQSDWDLDAFLSYQHIGIVWEKRSEWALDDVLANQGVYRNIALSVSGFEQALYFAATNQQQMFTVAPSYCEVYARQFGLPLTTLPLPVSEKQYQKLILPFMLLWHKRNSHTDKFKWLRKSIKSLASEFSERL